MIYNWRLARGAKLASAGDSISNSGATLIQTSVEKLEKK